MERGWLGVIIQEVNRDLAESFGLKKPQGALIAQVLAGSPAEKSGLKAGDIITEFDGKEVVLSSDLPYLVGSLPVGETVEIGLVRQGRAKTIEFEIGSLPKTGEQPSFASAEPPKVRDNRLGVTVSDAVGGVVVEFIEPGGVAATIGLRPGTLITMIGNKSIRSVDDFNMVLKGLPTNRLIPMRVVHNRMASFLAFKLPE